MSTKAKDLKRDDAFWLNVYGRVLAVARIANGKRVLVKISLEETSSLEFTNSGFIAEFICKPSRVFAVWSDWDDDGDGDGGEEPPVGPDPGRGLMLVG